MTSVEMAILHRIETAIHELDQKLDVVDDKLDRVTRLVSGEQHRFYEEIAAAIHLRAARLYALLPQPQPQSRSQPQRSRHPGETIMAVPQSITDALAQVDDATTKLGAFIAKLLDEIKVGMTQADVDSVKSRLGTVANQLTALAVDPNNPVPSPPPTP